MVEPKSVPWLLLATAIIAVTFTCVGLTIARRKRHRRARGVFTLGVVCGVVAGPMLLRRHGRRSSGLRAVRAATRAVNGANRFVSLGRTAGARRAPSGR